MAREPVAREPVRTGALRRALPKLLGHPADPAPRRGKPTATRITVPMRCAVADRDFTILFRSNALKPGIYFVERVAATQTGIGPGPETANSTLQIPIEQLPFHEINCPLCAHKAGPVRCGSCRRLMCKGRTEEDFFRCCSSCGASGVMGNNLTEVSGQEGQANSILSRARSSPQVAGPSTQLLGRPK
jgi:hypothetical protein